MLHTTEVMAIFVIFWPILAKIWLPWQRLLDPCNQKCLLWIGRGQIFPTYLKSLTTICLFTIQLLWRYDNVYSYTPFTRYNRLPDWQPVWQPCWTNSVQPVVKPGCTTGLTTGCIRVWQPVVIPVWQQVVSCKRGFSTSMLKLFFGRKFLNRAPKWWF